MRRISGKGSAGKSRQRAGKEPINPEKAPQNGPDLLCLIAEIIAEIILKEAGERDRIRQDK